MKEIIFNNLNNPHQLEKMYRENKNAFRREFNFIYPEISNQPVAQIWHERLNYDEDEISWGSSTDLIAVLVIAFLAGMVAKLPDIFSIPHEQFYPRNISFIVFPFLTAWFAWKQNISVRKLMAVAAILLLAVLFINWHPGDVNSDTFILSCIHLPLFLWSVLGFTFTGDQFKDYRKRLEFLRYNGDMAVMIAVIVIASGLFTAITFGLFELIEINIYEFYSQYVIVFGAAAVPVVATWLVRTNPQLVSKVSPVIAKVFTPLVFITLIVYLTAVIYTGKDPYNDRDFLLIFNLLLIGVMAIILFSVAETSKNITGKAGLLLLLGLAAVTIVINGIALSAILFRINEWGFTPNRLAVLGSNVIILIHLLMVTYSISNAIKHKNDFDKVAVSISAYLPVYTFWVVTVTFILPFVFAFK